MVTQSSTIITTSEGSRPKKQPIGWIGPSEGRGPGTSLGKGRWRVIDLTGQWIASGFTTRAHALRWIDGFNLLQAGHCLSNPDHRWFLLHWYRARPTQPDPKPPRFDRVRQGKRAS